MRVILYGATGKTGSIILKALVDRGHTAMAVARTPAKVRKLQNVDVIQGDLGDPAKVAGIVKGADAVVSAMGRRPTRLLRSSELLTASFKASSELADLVLL
jgi:putative NADH-flavin reductase